MFSTLMGVPFILLIILQTPAMVLALPISTTTTITYAPLETRQASNPDRSNNNSSHGNSNNIIIIPPDNTATSK